MSVMRLSAKMDRTDSGTPWGFRLTGGKDFGAPLIIQKVNPGSLAAKCGLQVGDTIVRIGASPADGLRHKDAQQKILEAGNSLELALERSSPSDVSTLTTLTPERPAVFVPPVVPAGYKPAISAKPVLPAAPTGQEIGDTCLKSVPALCQTNIGEDNTIDVQIERKTIVISPRTQNMSSNSAECTSKLCSDDKKKYYPSETLKLVHEQDTGNLESHVNPLTGADIKSQQSLTLMHLDKNLVRDQLIDVSTERKTIVIPSSKSQTSQLPAVTGPSRSSSSWQPQIPTGPRTMRVAKAGEAKSLPAVIGGVRIPVCSGCGIAIRGPFVSALDKTWCPDHFICANPNCRVPLVSCGFVEEAGQLFCERDYEQYFAPRCGKCGRAIIGTVVSALEMKFHVECFTCFHCHEPIINGLFHVESGRPYCDKDWAAMFQTKCFGCQFPIEPGDRWVEALNQNWHSECFNCSTCQVNLEGQSFFAKGGKPYCKKHSAGGRF